MCPGGGQQQIDLGSHLVVGIDILEEDFAVSPHCEDRRHGQRFFLGWPVPDTKSAHTVSIPVCKQRETQTALLFGLPQPRRSVGSDGDDLKTQFFEFLFGILQLDQLPIAMRSPPSPVEHQDRSLPRERTRQIDCRPIFRLQRHLGHRSPDQQRTNRLWRSSQQPCRFLSPPHDTGRHDQTDRQNYIYPASSQNGSSRKNAGERCAFSLSPAPWLSVYSLKIVI